MDETGKEESGSKSIRTKPTPKFLDVGKRKVLSSGRWHTGMMALFAIDNFDKNPNRWVSIGELTKTATGNGSPRSKQSIRRRLRFLAKELLDAHNKVLMIRYDAENHNRAMAIKVFNATSEEDQDTVEVTIKRMEARRDYTAGQIEKVQRIVGVNLAQVPKPAGETQATL